VFKKNSRILLPLMHPTASILSMVVGSSPTVCSVHLLDKAHHQTQPVNAAMVKGSEGGRHRGVAREKLGEDKRNVKGE
jgi:hypothetical protein